MEQLENAHMKLRMLEEQVDHATSLLATREHANSLDESTTSGGSCCCCEAPQKLFGAFQFTCPGDWLKTKLCYGVMKGIDFGMGTKYNNFTGIQKFKGKWIKCMGLGNENKECDKYDKNGAVPV